MLSSLRNLFRKEPAAAPVKEEKAKMVISSRALTPRGGDVAPQKAFALPQAAPGVIPRDAKMACDSAMGDAYAYAMQGALSEGLGFMGYPYLAELTQRPEYRRPAEILAKEMTRKWIKLQVTGEDDKGDKLKIIEAELKRLNVQDTFRRAAEQDGFFGRAQVYLDMGNASPDELRTPLADSVAKIGKDGIQRLVVVEPIWTYPNAYNSTSPLAADFFKSTSWFVQGQQIHATRLLILVSREVPDLLKPAYAFGGISLSQIAKPYVDNWLRTRQSVSDLLHSFSTNGLKTNLSGALNGGAGDDEYARMSLFNANRDNQGLLVIDNDTEDFFNVSAPLGSLDKLQAQAQEHMAAVTGIPLVVLLGITPSGLNASSDGEIRTFYAWIEAQQEDVFRRPLVRIINIIQLAKFGEIDPEIGFRFEPLWSLDEAAAATVRKTNAETGQILITAGVIDTDEERARLAGEEDSPYAGLDLNKEIVPPDQGSEDPEDPEDPEDDPKGAQDGWITVHPNGPDHKGQPALIGEGGLVEAGMGGKFNGKHISQVKAGVGVKPGNSVAVVPEKKESAPAPDLESAGLMREFRGKWQYKSSPTGGWMTANSKEGAAKEAASAYASLPLGQRMTREERSAKADAEYEAESAHRYSSKSIPQLEAEVERLNKSIRENQKAGEREFNGGGRRTSAAVSSEAARVAGEEKMRLERHIESRKAQEQAGEEGSASPVGLTDKHRELIAKSDGAFREKAPPGMSREEFSAQVKAGKLDHLFNRPKSPEERKAEAQKAAEAIKAAKKFKNDVWREKNVPTLAKAKAEREQREGEEKISRVKAAIAAHETSATPVAERQYLDVPFSEKDKAKALGARWDADKKRWYAGSGDLHEGLKQYSPKVIMEKEDAEFRQRAKEEAEKWKTANEAAGKSFAAIQKAQAESAQKTAEAAKTRNYLNVPFAKKDKAKAAGAKWDADKRKWYHPGGELPASLQKYSQASVPQSAEPKKYTPPALPTSGRISEDDPSIYGHELLGHEGESWASFHNSYNGQALKSRREGAAAPKSGEDSAMDDTEWHGWDDPANYEDEDDMTGSDDPSNYEQ